MSCNPMVKSGYEPEKKILLAPEDLDKWNVIVTPTRIEMVAPMLPNDYRPVVADFNMPTRIKREKKIEIAEFLLMAAQKHDEMKATIQRMIDAADAVIDAHDSAHGKLGSAICELTTATSDAEKVIA